MTKRRGGLPDRTPPREGAPAAWPGPRAELAIAALLLALHAALVSWGIRTQSVTFDESFHVPAGVVHLDRGDPGVSPVNPPLVKLLFGAAALSAGAVAPSDSALATRDQFAAGESFMRRNADRFHDVFAAARLVSLALSLALAGVVWRAARRRGGPLAGIVALAAWSLAPEALAHAGIASMDVATALGWTAVALALDAFLRSGRWRDWSALALAVAFFATTRFSAFLVAPLALLALALYAARGRLVAPRAAVARIALLAPVAWVALGFAYGEWPVTRPLAESPVVSAKLVALRDAAPWLRLPVPGTMLEGLDRQMLHGEPGKLATYVNGEVLLTNHPMYFPYAVLCKWPLAILLAIAARLAFLFREGGRCGTGLWLPGVLFLFALVFMGVPNAGVRYALPLLPLFAIGIGDLAGGVARESAGRFWRGMTAAFAAILVAALAVEVLPSGPNWLPFFHRLAGEPALCERRLNDSNVDWGQGLIALREEMARRGIRRIHLAYHGTVDPAVYGIDYVPYRGGAPGPESDWLAMSSYFYVGLPSRPMTQEGFAPAIAVYGAEAFRPLVPVARPGGCMLLWKIR